MSPSESNSIAEFYRLNPHMVSSPFGGINGVNRRLFTKVFKSLEIDLSENHVLDIGCGRGYVGDYVRDRKGSYTGIDLVNSRAEALAALGDAQALPFADDSFDGAFCIDAFEHIPDPKQAASEIRRVVKPGGFFFLSAPNYENIAGMVKRTYEGLGLYEKNTWAPFGRWQAQELETHITGTFLKKLFRNAGFKRVKLMGHDSEVGLGLFPWIDHPKTPEAIQFRLQKVFALAGPPIAQVWPGASLHGFWKWYA